MKLKSIMHALSYGKSRKALVRSEGARRVKQAEKLVELRQRMKMLTYSDRYGSSTNLQQYQVYEVLRENSNKVLGIEILEEDFGVFEEKLSAYVQGRAAGKTL